MKKQLMKCISLALLVILTATLTLPETAARYILTQGGVAGIINFTDTRRTDTFYIETETDSEPTLWANEYKDADGTLLKPTNEIKEEFGIERTNEIIYPMVNVSGEPVYCSFVVSFCAMDYTQIKHQDKNELIVNYTVTLTVTRSGGKHVTLQMKGLLVTGLDSGNYGNTLGAVNLSMGNEPQYSGKSPGSGNVDYMIYTAMVDPTLATMTIGGQSALTKTENGVTSPATLADFVILPGDSADCQINLVFEGGSHSQTNADACYAAIGLMAKPVD